MKNATWYLKLTAFWVLGFIAILVGMTAMYYSWQPEWWPMFLNNPGVCLVWIGIIFMTADKELTLSEVKEP